MAAGACGKLLRGRGACLNFFVASGKSNFAETGVETGTRRKSGGRFELLIDVGARATLNDSPQRQLWDLQIEAKTSCEVKSSEGEGDGRGGRENRAAVGEGR